MAVFQDLLAKLGFDISGYQDGVTKAMSLSEKLSQKLNIMDREANKAFSGFDKLGGRLTDLGASLSIGITAPIAAVGTVAVKAFGDFESALNRVSAVGDITGGDLNKLKQQAIDLGAKTQFSAKQAAEGMGELAASGFDATKIFDAMPAVLNLAAAGQLQVGQAAEIASNLMAGFGIPASDISKSVDLIAKAAASGSLSVQDLGLSFKYVGPIATTAGLSFEEVSSAITLLSNAGIKGEQAGTGLRGMIEALVNPSAKASEALGRLGITATDSSGKLLPLDQIIGQLGKSGATTSDIFAIFGQNAASSVAALVNTGAPALQKMTTELQNSEGAAAKMAGTLQQGLGGAMERMRGSVETAAISLGESLAPVIIKLAGWIEGTANKVAEFGQWFAKLPDPIQNVAIAFTALVAAAGPMLIMFGQLLSSIGTISLAFNAPGGLLASLGYTGGMAGLMAAATPLAIAFGAAIAAWAIYEAVTKFQALNKEMERLEDLQRRGIKASEDQMQQIRLLESAIASHNKEIGNQRIEIDKTGKSTEQYIAELKEATKGLGKFSDAGAGLSAAMKDGKIQLKALVDEQKKLGTTLKKTGDEAKGATGDHQKHGKALDEVAKAAQRTQRANEEMVARYEKDARDFVTAATRMNDATKQLERSNAELATNFAKAHQSIRDEAQKTVAIIVPETQRIPAAVQEAIKKNQELQGAYKNLGITSSADLAKLANEARISFEKISASGAASANDVLAAEKKALDASIAARRAAGEAISNEEKARLSQLEGVLGVHVEKQKNTWDGLGKQVSTIFTDLSRNITDAIFSGESLGQVFKDVFEEMGKAVVRFVIEHIQGKLTKAFLDLIDGPLDALGKKLGGLFGTGADAAAGAAGAAGDAAGAAAGGAGQAAGSAGSAAGSAVAQVTNVISGVVSAIADVVTAIGTIRLEGTMNAVEHNTRYSMMYLGERADGGILGVLFRILDQVSFGFTAKASEAMRDMMIAFNTPALIALEGISSNTRYLLMKVDDLFWDIKNLSLISDVLFDIKDIGFAIKDSLAMPKTAAPVAAATGGAMTLNVHVQADTADGQRIAAAISQELRRNGFRGF